jgi:hypothetical protein
MDARHKITWGPGYRIFECYECGHEWKEKSHDCQDLSEDACDICNELVWPHDYERHFEWPTDAYGNLVEDNDNRYSVVKTTLEDISIYHVRDNIVGMDVVTLYSKEEAEEICNEWNKD